MRAGAYLLLLLLLVALLGLKDAVVEPMRLPGTNRREPEDKKTGIKWIPGYELAKNKHYVGSGWRRSPELVEEAKKRIDPKMTPLEDRVYLVTGSNKGHGLETAARLLDCGATVILHGRMEGRVRKWLITLSQAFQTRKIDAVVGDFCESEEVEAVAQLIAEKHPKIHGILHNAATIDGQFTGKRRYNFNYRMELTMAVNAIAPFQLTSLLMPQLRAAGNARVMFSSSPTMSGDDYLDDIHCKRYWTGLHAYRLSKLCMEMMAKEMDVRYGKAPELTFHSFFPGTADTKIHRQGAALGSGRKLQRAKLHVKTYSKPSYLPPPATRKASFWAMVDDIYQQSSGTFVSDDDKVTSVAVNDAVARGKLWEEFTELSGAKWPEYQALPA